jgi:hypothetical protein
MKYADDIQRCIICGSPTRSRGNDSWIQMHGVRFCSRECEDIFEEKYFHSLHTPDWYPIREHEQGGSSE